MNDVNNKINKFRYTLINNFNDIDLANFYSNIESLKVIFTSDNIYGKLDYYTNGNYDYQKNKILIKKDDIENTDLFHELFHMASNANDYRDGFYIFKNHKNIGIGINEGYTELLTRRFFGKNYDNYNYEFEVIIANYIEDIVEKNIMESLYLRADLMGLINELEKYNSNAFSFIMDVDYVSNYIYNDDLHDEIINRVKRINDFIVNCRLKKYYDKYGMEYINNNYDSIFKVWYDVKELNKFNVIQDKFVNDYLHNIKK